MGTMPTVGIPGQAMPTQDISYYPAYYPTQQPMIYDPNQLPQGQPGSYYYMSAPPPPPPHQSHQLHPSTMSAEQQQQQQQQQQQMGMLPQQAPHPGYYYQQYYQAPPPPIAQPTQHSHTFSSSAMGMHQQGQIGGIPNASVSPSDGQPQLTTQQGNDGHSFSLSGGLQHTAAVMIAPVIALSPTMTYKRRDSKMDILSELCTAVLDRDKQRDQPGGDSDASVTEDDCRQVDEAKLSTNWMGTRHDISNNKTLFDEWKPMHDNKKETWNDRWDRHTTPPPSPKMESYRRASSADMLCEKDYAVQRNSFYSINLVIYTGIR
ncbi:hypothetical protein BDF19DRAFT_158421 [Syncephalis fuscata]|nr:hypothetical protein BDF19DRAFT_158421 [Syncephalis fuscata]